MQMKQRSIVLVAWLFLAIIHQVFGLSLIEVYSQGRDITKAEKESILREISTTHNINVRDAVDDMLALIDIVENIQLASSIRDTASKREADIGIHSLLEKYEFTADTFRYNYEVGVLAYLQIIGEIEIDYDKMPNLSDFLVQFEREVEKDTSSVQVSFKKCISTVQRFMEIEADAWEILGDSDLKKVVVLMGSLVSGCIHDFVQGKSTRETWKDIGKTGGSLTVRKMGEMAKDHQNNNIMGPKIADLGVKYMEQGPAACLSEIDTFLAGSKDRKSIIWDMHCLHSNIKELWMNSEVLRKKYPLPTRAICQIL